MSVEIKKLDLIKSREKYELALKLIDSIEYFENKKQLYISFSKSEISIFSNLGKKLSHQIDICERASDRLTKKLLSKNF